MRTPLPYGPKIWQIPALIKDKKARHKGVCAALNCRHKTNQRNHEKYCPKHKAKQWKFKNPAKYNFGKLRYAAKVRGIICTITFDEWLLFWHENRLAELRGRSAEALTVDRIKSSLGYEAGNIQVLTNRKNASKGRSDDPY